MWQSAVLAVYFQALTPNRKKKLKDFKHVFRIIYSIYCLSALRSTPIRAPRIYEGGARRAGGAHAVQCFDFAENRCEFVTSCRILPPALRATPLVNAGGKGAAVCSTNCNLTERYVTE